LTPPTSNAAKTGWLHFFRESLSVDTKAAEDEKGKQNVKLLKLLLLRRKSEVVTESVAFTEEIIISTQMNQFCYVVVVVALDFCQKFNEVR
jgi:hypothetical protein